MRIGHYAVEGLLGSGGMGEVYRCHDTRLDRPVAIKKLSAHFAYDPSRLARFFSEAKAVSALNHPNILTVHEIGESDSGPYLVTELVDGATVRDKLRGRKLPWREALDLAHQAASGLAKSHDAGVVHRDIKPENLMVTRDGLVKVLDFGLAKLVDQGIEGLADSNMTATGTIVGTPAYVAPERLEGHDADGRCDVFSLGVVLYEMLTGENPFVRANALATLHAIQNDTPVPVRKRQADVPAELAEVVARAMSKNRAERFADGNELRDALAQVRAHVDGAYESAGSAGAPSRRRPAWLVPVLVLGAVAFAATWITLGRQANEPATAEDDAASASGALATVESARVPGFTVQLPADKLGVAILPISDRSTDADLAEAGIGRILTDAFVQILADHPKLYVIAPHRLAGITRSFGHSFEDTSSDLDLARRVALGAQADVMLTGTFARFGKTYILSATLTELPSDVVADQFQVQSESVESLLAEVTAGVSRRLQKRFAEAPEAVDPDRRMPTESIYAYAYYVRGDDLLQEGRWPEAAIELRKSVDLDPEMALAWSSLSCAYSFNGDDAKAHDAAAQAQQLLGRVNERERRWIELDNVWVNTEDGDLYLAEMASFIRDYPDDRDGYFYAGLAEEYLKDDPAAALSWYEKAYWLVPSYYPVTKAIVDCQLKLGQRAEAIETLKRYVDQDHVGEHGRAQAAARLRELLDQS